jgi:hypothetical protein
VRPVLGLMTDNRRYTAGLEVKMQIGNFQERLEASPPNAVAVNAA